MIQRVLRMDLTEFETRPTGLYLFDCLSVRGNIWVFWHSKRTVTENVLVQFSGQGCREYEEVMREQQTDWRTWLYSIWKIKESWKLVIHVCNVADSILR